MNFFKYLLLMPLLFSCASKKATDFTKLKVDHENRMNIIKTFPDPFESKVNDSMKHWIPIFKNVYTDDQKYRIVGYNLTSEEWEKQNRLDSQNLKIVSDYIDKYGWPANTDIGFIGKRAVGMVIQHSPLKVQEKYYPYLVESFKKDKFLFETLALLEDRINMRKHRFQFYGSQIISYKGKSYLYPVANIDSIDIYRNQIGFQMPITDYFKLLNVNWNISDYKLVLPELIKEYKVSDTAGIHYVK